MDAPLFDQLEQTLTQAGPVAAVTKLCDELKARKDYPGLFYALLMKKRVELGVSPIATGSNQDLARFRSSRSRKALAKRQVDGLATSIRSEGQIPRPGVISACSAETGAGGRSA